MQQIPSNSQSKGTQASVNPGMRFNHVQIGKNMLTEIKERLNSWQEEHGRKLVLMEVCGTHTVALSKSGIRDALRPWVDLRSGPGCPVCVTDQADIDYMLELSTLPGVTVTTFGDMMRVPGSRGDLARAKANGADVKVVYSPLEAVEIAKSEPQRHVVFMGIGFETTVPTIAAALERAEAENLDNFSVYAAHKLTAPAVETLLQDPELKLDGLILPGHVSVITGRSYFSFVADQYALPAAITGFDALDILAGLKDILDQYSQLTPRVTNCYPRVVRENGNRKAWGLVERFFTGDTVKWRGLGEIPESGLVLRPPYARFDASKRFPLTLPASHTPKGCLCGNVLKGKNLPFDCRHFAVSCTPVHPVGPCMVSGEGTCSTYYKYERRDGSGYDTHTALAAE
ncbi:hydrogenase formation protein HypD [Paradesulfitobacterium ferrireducens]|uniref:hydrogenase formation protein HypD n=1 Tax=Paradesulfitobacterium ferrireducens TaxID=2816476 RepID=UPI001F1C5355|nr:hydrogenase formation protein HypD [Paradesulfitobacterium ferrireducens]